MIGPAGREPHARHPQVHGKTRLILRFGGVSSQCTTLHLRPMTGPVCCSWSRRIRTRCGHRAGVARPLRAALPGRLPRVGDGRAGLARGAGGRRRRRCLILAGQRLAGTTGSELLDEARHLHPHAKRGAADRLGRLRGSGDRRGDLRRHRARAASTTTCSGRRRPGRALPLRRSPACCWSGRRRDAPSPSRSTSSARPGPAGRTSSAGCSAAAPCRTSSAWPTRRRPGAGRRSWPAARLPLVVLPDGKILQDPSNAEIAIAVGHHREPASARTSTW